MAQSQGTIPECPEVSSPQTPLVLSSETPRGKLWRMDEMKILSPGTEGFKPGDVTTLKLPSLCYH